MMLGWSRIAVAAALMVGAGLVCLIRIGKTIIGESGSWRGIDDPGCGPTALHAHGVAGPSHAGLMGVEPLARMRHVVRFVGPALQRLSVRVDRCRNQGLVRNSHR
jgi:hypothetical protein